MKLTNSVKNTKFCMWVGHEGILSTWEDSWHWFIKVVLLEITFFVCTSCSMPTMAAERNKAVAGTLLRDRCSVSVLRTCHVG